MDITETISTGKIAETVERWNAVAEALSSIITYATKMRLT
jgi:hypothetical protein